MILPEFDMNYNETFNSQVNTEIRRRLVLEPIKALKPNYRASFNQINNCLKSLHRSRQSRNNYENKGRLDDDNHRLYANSQLNEV